MAWYTAIASKARYTKLKFWLTFAVACAIAQGIEFAAHHLGAEDGKESPAVHSLMAVTGLYQMIVSAPRQPAVRQTALVVIDPKNDIVNISAANVCVERELMARLLIRIAREHPNVIAIDKYFLPQSCPRGDPGTSALINALKAIGPQVPAIITGARATEIETGADLARARNLASHHIEETLDLGKGAGAPLKALLNLSMDLRKLPLQWYVYPDKASIDSGSPAAFDALAFAAAKHQRPLDVEQAVKRTGLLESGQLPYVGFITPAQFAGHRLYASEVLCGRRLAENEDWRRCDGTSALPVSLRGKVVVIGENAESADQHATIVGTMAGFYLHANYIEALLDDRFLRPAGVWADVLFSLGFLVLLDMALVVFHNSVPRAVLSVAFLCLFAVAIVYLLAMFHIYVDPSLVTGAAVLIKTVHSVYAWVPREHHAPGMLSPETNGTTNEVKKGHRGRSPSSPPHGPGAAGSSPRKRRRRK